MQDDRDSMSVMHDTGCNTRNGANLRAATRVSMHVPLIRQVMTRRCVCVARTHAGPRTISPTCTSLDGCSLHSGSRLLASPAQQAHNLFALPTQDLNFDGAPGVTPQHRLSYCTESEAHNVVFIPLARTVHEIPSLHCPFLRPAGGTRHRRARHHPLADLGAPAGAPQKEFADFQTRRGFPQLPGRCIPGRDQAAQELQSLEQC